MAGDRKFCTDLHDDSRVLKRILEAVDDCGIRWRAGQLPVGFTLTIDTTVSSQYLAVSEGVLHGSGNDYNYEVVSNNEFINRCIGGAYA